MPGLRAVGILAALSGMFGIFHRALISGLAGGETSTSPHATFWLENHGSRFEVAQWQWQLVRFAEIGAWAGAAVSLIGLGVVWLSYCAQPRWFISAARFRKLNLIIGLTTAAPMLLLAVFALISRAASLLGHTSDR